MRNLRASTGRSSVLLSVHIMFTKELSSRRRKSFKI
jgi:hypothetical protein